MTKFEELLGEIFSFGTLSISSREPIFKTIGLTCLAKAALDSDMQVTYLDFDLQFSSLYSCIQDSLKQSNVFTRLDIIRPSSAKFERELIDFIASLQSAKRSERGLVILDSLNSFEHLLVAMDGRYDWVAANRLAFLYLTLLQMQTKSLGMTLIISNLLRSRPPRSPAHDRQWSAELVGGRLVTQKSKAILYIETSKNLADNESEHFLLKAVLKLTKESDRGIGFENSRSYLLEVPHYMFT
jgi:hypothetical protein